MLRRCHLIVASWTHLDTLCQLWRHNGNLLQLFYRPDAIPDAQPTVSKHWRQQSSERCWYKNIYMSAAIVIRQLPSAIGHQLILIVGHSRHLCSTVSGWLVLPRVWGVMCGLCGRLAHSTTGSTYNEPNKKLCYRRRTVWRDVPIKILPTAAKQCSKRS